MKKIVCLLLVLSFLLCGCDADLLEQIKPSQDGGSANPSEPEETYLEIEDMVQLRDFIHQQMEEGNLEFSFEYTGRGSLDPQTISQIATASFVNLWTTGDVYKVEITRYPGDRIVAAYLSGDTSKLSEEEQDALEMALDMVAQAQEESTDEWELELLIHDMLAEHITYYDGNKDFDDPDDLPRNLSVIGALLDGKANCQGYADAFYTLASIAGFRVGRMSVETPNVLHTTNTIFLNGQWYVVDVTFDDQDATDSVNHRLFNAGMDMILEFDWTEDKEIHPIAQESGEAYYYFHEGIVYDDLDKMAEAIAAHWAKTGDTVIPAMLRDETDGTKLNDALYDALDQTGKTFYYTFLHITNGRDTFYTVEFSN